MWSREEDLQTVLSHKCDTSVIAVITNMKAIRTNCPGQMMLLWYS